MEDKEIIRKIRKLLRDNNLPASKYNIEQWLIPYRSGIKEGIRWVGNIAYINENVYDESWGCFCIDPEQWEEVIREWGLGK